jgi:hypothetical protein
MLQKLYNSDLWSRPTVPNLLILLMVPGGGLEPPHLAAADFESAASTDSAIPAQEAVHYPQNSI